MSMGTAAAAESSWSSMHVKRQDRPRLLLKRPGLKALRPGAPKARAPAA